MLRRLWLVPALCLAISSASPLLAEPDTPAPTPRPARTTHLLNLALLVAGNKPADAGEPLPAPVAKAVADIKDFLPFKNYRMLDSAMVRTASDETITVELQGTEQSRYRAQFAYSNAGPGQLNFHRFEVVMLTDMYGRRAGLPVPPRENPGPNQAPEPPVPPREVITTGFGIGVGETIVVGTSRLRNEDRALMVVLTALPGK